MVTYKMAMLDIALPVGGLACFFIMCNNMRGDGHSTPKEETGPFLTYTTDDGEQTRAVDALRRYELDRPLLELVNVHGDLDSDGYIDELVGQLFGFVDVLEGDLNTSTKVAELLGYAKDASTYLRYLFDSIDHTERAMDVERIGAELEVAISGLIDSVREGNL